MNDHPASEGGRTPAEAAIEIVELQPGESREVAFAIRRAVFCVEQGVTPALEFDGRDAHCRHYLAFRGGCAVATARLRPLGPGEAKIERLAVLREARGAGVGRALMRRLMDDARAAGLRRIVLHAQLHAVPFYLPLGLEAEGEPFEEAGLAHQRMTRAL